MEYGDSAYIRRFFSVYSQEEKDKVRGHAFYPTDYLSALLPENVAHVHVVRSPHPGASFSKINTKKAEKLEGVLKVITAQDIPNNIAFGGAAKDSQLILAEKRVRYVGEPVALIVGESTEVLQKAAEVIEIDWKPEETTQEVIETLSLEEGRSNRAQLLEVKTQFRFPSLHARYLETESGWVDYKGDQLEFHVGSLLSESQRVWLSKILDVSLSSIRAKESYLGGQFGGRQQRELIVFLALASHFTKRSCSLALEYGEQDVGSYGFSGELSIFYDEAAARMRELGGTLRIDSGSYEGSAAKYLKRALDHVSGVYDFDAVHVNAEVIRTSSHPRRALKGEGITAVTWVTEQLVDQVARALDIPALDFRVAHCNSNLASASQVFEEVERVERPFRLITIDRNRPAWDEKAVTGRGFAFQSFHSDDESPVGSLDVSIELTHSGAFVIRTSNYTLDLHFKSALCEVAAAVLRTHPKAFTVEGEMRLEFDKPRRRETYPEFYYMAHATWHAAQALKGKILEVGRKQFESDEVELSQGAVVDKKRGRKRGYRELAFTNSRHELMGDYTLDGIEAPHACSAGAVSRVAFHPLTGELRVDSVKVIVDSGPVVYQTGLEVEAESAVSWAMAALFSSTVERDQPIPTPMDGPEEVSLFPIEYPLQAYADEAPNFFGSRGVPDVMMAVVLGSLVTAIQDAKNTCLEQIPMLPAFMYPDKKAPKVRMLQFRK